jgi:hypothetical protein
VRRRATQALSAVLAAIGVVLIARGALGGGWAGVVIGVLFLLAGLGRLYLSRR